MSLLVSAFYRSSNYLVRYLQSLRTPFDVLCKVFLLVSALYAKRPAYAQTYNGRGCRLKHRRRSCTCTARGYDGRVKHLLVFTQGKSHQAKCPDAGLEAQVRSRWKIPVKWRNYCVRRDVNGEMV